MTNDFDNHDHENHDDFVDPELGSHGGKSSMSGNLAEAWRTRPMFKFMVLLFAIFAVGVAAFSFMGGSNNSNLMARLGKPPAMKEAPGGTVSPAFRDQTKLADNERVSQAANNGGSAVPTPMGATSNIGDFGDTGAKDDPLKELRAETEQLKKEVQKQQVAQQQQTQAQHQNEQFDNSMAEAMQRQMQQLLEGWAPKGIKQVDVIKVSELKQEEEKAAQANTTGVNGAAANAANEQPKVVVSAGTVSYAQLLTEANSDVPGPILAQIVSGPLAGARAVGSFQVSVGYDKYLVLKFSIADRKGKDYSINAIALDPSTTLGGMATEVDERYFARVVLPAAAGFMQGFGQGVAQGNSTITQTGTTTTTTIAGNSVKYGMYNGLGQAGQTLGQFFQDQANLTKPLVRVAAGTPMGLFFVAPVTEPTAGTNAALVSQQNQNGALPVNTGFNNMNSYPGTTVTGYGGVNASGANAGPYPNYATPGSGYNGLGSANRSVPLNSYGGPGSAPLVQGYGQ